MGSVPLMFSFLVDCFVLGCLDWSRLFTLFRLVLVLLGCFFDVQVVVYCVKVWFV